MRSWESGGERCILSGVQNCSINVLPHILSCANRKVKTPSRQEALFRHCGWIALYLRIYKAPLAVQTKQRSW